MRNRINIRLINNEKYFLNVPQKQTIRHKKYFIDSNFVAISKRRLALKLNKPAYIEMWLLELSKTLIYQFHFDYIKNKHKNESKLLFTGTNSLMYEIQTEDIY